MRKAGLGKNLAQVIGAVVMLVASTSILKADAPNAPSGICILNKSGSVAVVYSVNVDPYDFRGSRTPSTHFNNIRIPLNAMYCATLDVNNNAGAVGFNFQITFFQTGSGRWTQLYDERMNNENAGTYSGYDPFLPATSKMLTVIGTRKVCPQSPNEAAPGYEPDIGYKYCTLMELHMP